MIKFGNNNIGKLYFGSNPIGKAYLGSNLVYQSGGGPSPQPTTIPYIRGGADGSYIDTGIVPDSTTRVIVWARNFNPNSGFIFGSRVAFQNQAFALNANAAEQSGRITVNYGNVLNNTSSGDHFKYLSGYHRYEMRPISVSVDDTQLYTGSGTFSGNSLNLHIFGLNNGGTHTNTVTPMDICACKIYKGGALVRDYTAVNTPYVGLYDAVSQTLFTNAGSGSFTYGEFDKNAYTPLEYIECDGKQYFDSGVNGGYAIPIKAKFRYTKTSQNVTLLGYRGSSDWCEFDINSGSTVSVFYRLAKDSTWHKLYQGASSNVVDSDLVLLKENTNAALLYKNNVAFGSKIAPSSANSFVTSDTLCVCALNRGGTSSNAQPFIGRVYYVGIGNNRSFVPAKQGSRVGMYDTYNDVFYPSATSTPFVAGPEIEGQLTHFFSGKNLAIIGDSISTYNADGYKYDSYSMYYPYGEVNSVEYTYWKKLMNDENATLEVNLSYSGSCACSRSGYVSLNDRIGLIGNADTVIIALGTNDSAQSKPLGDYLYDTPYSELGEANFREAYIKGIKGLLAANPNIDIVCAIFSMNSDYRNSIKAIAEHYGLKCIDCGNAYAKLQGVHPNIAGMIEIERHFLYD